MSKIRHVFYNSALSQKVLTCPKSVDNRILPVLTYLFTFIFLPFIAISWTIKKIIMSCHVTGLVNAALYVMCQVPLSLSGTTSKFVYEKFKYK